jgi:hypothetical protein
MFTNQNAIIESLTKTQSKWNKLWKPSSTFCEYFGNEYGMDVQPPHHIEINMPNTLVTKICQPE